ncbi:MAG TPA: hypothetical protein VGK73_09535 [Polyangiaceae bacterium]
MTRPLRDLSAFPLRDHGAPDRVDRIWRRLSPELTPHRREPSRSFWGPALLVAAFGSGVFVGARWLRPEAQPTLSAERPRAPERAAGLATPLPERAEVLSEAEPKARPLQKSRAVAVVARSPVLLPLASAEPAEQTPAPVSGPPDWERLSEAGDFEAARASLDAAGGFDAVLGSASASQLMTLVDLARASGSREHAILALRRVVEVFRAAPEAPLAAWTLGNVLDQAGDQAGAAEAFALYRRLSPGGDFAEDALAHEVARAFTLGDLELSARLVAQYENEFPNGPRLEEFRAEQAKRSARAIGPEVPEPVEPDLLAEPALEEPGYAETPATKPSK